VKYVFGLFVGFSLFVGVALGAQEMPYHIPDVVTHQIKSTNVDQTFAIHVWQPVTKKDGSEKFPVLYITDANGGIAMAELIHLLHIGGDAPRFIVVGIGYPVDHSVGGLNIRNRDLTPTPSAQLEAEFGLPIDGVLSITSGKKTGGAKEFLSFIRDELVPFVDKNYNTIEGDRGFFGDSLGGLFGLYTLFHKPDTFSRYIIGSPSIWSNDTVSFKYAEKFLASDQLLNARIYMSVGELEELAGDQMVSNVYKMFALLKSKPMPDLDIKMEVIPGETHTSVIGINLIKGIQAVYDRPKCSFMDPRCPQ
jgi:hypothetical protein